MDFDELKQLREQITNSPDQVTDEQLDAAVAAIREQVTEARAATPSPELIATLEDLKGIREAVVGVQTQRAEQAAQVNAEAERLLADLDTPEQPADTEGGEVVDQAGEPGDATPAEQAPAAEQTPELVAASGALADAIVRGIREAFAERTPQQPAPAAQPQGRTGRPASNTSGVKPAGDVATAKVYLGSHSEQGRPVTSDLDVARAIWEKYRGAYQARGSNGRMPVLTVDTAFPESRILGSDSDANYEKIRAATAPSALTAAGFCAPLEVMYDIDVLGSTARPIRDALARFTVERGGIQYRPNSSAAAAVNGAGVWTAEDDEAVGGADESVKDCYVVDCPDLENATVQAIYSCLEFANMTARFDPESTAANVREGLIAHARLAERELYKAMAADSKLVVANPQDVGAVRHILGEMDRLVAYYRDRHRLDSNQPLTWLAPQWVRDLMRADLAYQMAAGDWQDALAVADQDVVQWFTRRSVSPVWFLDGATTQQTVNGQTIPPQVYSNLAAGATIPQFPTPVDTLLYPTGSFLFLDGGTLDLGLVRDSELIGRNRYRQFSETFEGVASRGVEPLRPLFDVQPTGASSGTVSVDFIGS